MVHILGDVYHFVLYISNVLSHNHLDKAPKKLETVEDDYDATNDVYNAKCFVCKLCAE